MWQRFTDQARRVIFHAQEEAGRLGESYVSTEHFLLAIIREKDTMAAWTLDRFGVSLGRIRSEIERQVTRADRLGHDLQLTPRARRVIELAYDEARLLDNKYIGTEHLLLGMIREGEGLAARVLLKLGLTLERTRREVKAGQDAREKGRAPDHPPEPAKEFAKIHEDLETTIVTSLLQTYAEGQNRFELKLDQLLENREGWRKGGKKELES